MRYYSYMVPKKIRHHYMSIGLASLLLAFGLVIAPSIHFSNNIVDISWPNCKHAAVYAQSGIVGVTGGLDFRPNPCLNDEFGWLNHAALYMNTGYPGVGYARRFSHTPQQCQPTASRCLAYNYGYNASLYAIHYAASRNAHSNLWWLDVETENSWSTNTTLNKAALQGAVDALKQTIPFVTVGIYSDGQQWGELTGGWPNHLPSWMATGAAQLSAARSACQAPSFDAGTNWLAQYTPGNVDINYPCNGLFEQHLLE